MHRISILFLKAVVALIGIGALAFLVWEPQVEGRNLHATQFQIYFHDPFLAYAYVGSIAFFVGVYQTFTLLGRIGRGETFSPANAASLRTIRLCAVLLIGFVVAGELIFILFNDSDDRAGGVFMGVLICFISTTVAAAATVLEGSVRAGMASRE